MDWPIWLLPGLCLSRLDFSETAAEEEESVMRKLGENNAKSEVATKSSGLVFQSEVILSQWCVMIYFQFLWYWGAFLCLKTNFLPNEQRHRTKKQPLYFFPSTLSLSVEVSFSGKKNKTKQNSFYLWKIRKKWPTQEFAASSHADKRSCCLKRSLTEKSPDHLKHHQLSLHTKSWVILLQA